MSLDRVDTAAGTREILLVYDEDCPLCNAYCRLIRIRETVGDLRLVNARASSDVVREITRKGLDIDQGMVLKVDDVLYYGADAICALSLLSSASGVFNRLNHWIFRSSTRAELLYPLLRGCRNLFLRILCRTKINNLGLQGNERF
jgi:predicted DCC family thiol-disulfide oxidoreductase YuxK